MLKVVKTIGKVLCLVSFLLAVSAVATAVYCYHYKDQIVQNFIHTVNKKLNYPIQVRSIQLNALKSFPNVTLVLEEVIVKSPVKATNLIALRKVHCTFDLWKLYQGQYILNQLSLEQGKVDLAAVVAYQSGQKKGRPLTIPADPSLMMSLHKLVLKDIAIMYGSKDKYYTVNIAQSQTSLHWIYPKLEIEVVGLTAAQRIQHKGLGLQQSGSIGLRGKLTYNQEHKIWSLQSVQLKQADTQLTIQGSWGVEQTAPIQVTIQGRKVPSAYLASYLPAQFNCQFQRYVPQGNLDFNLKLAKDLGKDQAVALQGSFLLKHGFWTTNYFSRPINLPELSGELHMPHIQDPKTAVLKVNRFVGTLADSQVEGSLLLRDFQRLQLQGEAKAIVDLASLNKLSTQPLIADAAGQLTLSCKLKGSPIHDIPIKAGFHLTGALQAQAVQFNFASSPIQYKNVNGSLVFQDNVLVVKDCTGSIGPGNFVLKGTVQNLLPFLLAKDQKLYTDAKVYVDTLDLDTIFADSGKLKTQTSKGFEKFTIPPHWVLDLDCNIQQLLYRRFQGKNVRSKLKIKDQKLVAKNLQLGFYGGKASLDGTLDATTDNLTIHTKARIKDVGIDQLFYVFENFHQDFLIDKHLSGKVFTDFNLNLEADRQWNIKWDTLEADIDLRLNNGVLCHFAPIQQLYKYATEESLSDLHFSELKNRVRIKHKTIYIPVMEVHSNLAYMRLSGTHTFDGKIDYDFVFPLANLQQTATQGHAEEITEDALAGINLFLKLQGKVNDYQITYNTEALKASLKGKLKEQRQVLRQILRGKYKGKTKIKRLASDEYFEFE